MDLRYSKLFKVPRKAFKHFLSAIYPVVVKIWPLPKVLSIDETLDKIINDKCSICRFGDGEFLYIIDRLDLPFQKQEPLLREKMIEILKSNKPNILVGLPIGYHSLKNLKKNSRLTWRSQISWIYPRLRKYLDPDKTYYNASMTRLYMDYKDTIHSGAWFQKAKAIWGKRDILLIEGEKSRLGIGNDLFNNVSSVRRVLGPAHDAFTQFDKILRFVLQQPTYYLVLVAMGPTAKPMCYALALNGFQAIDIGNIDIEYEWFVRGVKDKVKISGKYTSEAIGGRKVEDINDNLYHSQIIAQFLK